MAKRPLYAIVAVGGIALASGAAWWYQNRATPSGVETGKSAAGAPTGGAPAAGVAPGRGPGGGGPGGGGTPAVEVTQAKTMRLQDDAQSVGTLRSRQSVTLRPEVAGRVAQISFSDGARVRKGQVLLRLDDTLQRAELSQAEAQLSIARANLKRNQELVAENFVAQRVLDESRASLQVAEAQVALARARLERMSIKAPFDGVVGLRLVDLGAYVKDGADLVNLEDTSALQVDYRLPERYQTQVSVGKTVQVALDALPGKTFAAQVAAVDPLLDANGRSLAVRATLPGNAGGQLRPGMFARVTTVFNVFDDAVEVPEEALVPQGGKQYVVRIEEAGEGSARKPVSKRVEVRLGARRGPQVQVLEGVAPGDTVVIAGQQRLQKDGTAVRIVELGRRPGGGKPGEGKPADGKPGDGKPEGGAPATGGGAPATGGAARPEGAPAQPTPPAPAPATGKAPA